LSKAILEKILKIQSERALVPRSLDQLIRKSSLKNKRIYEATIIALIVIPVFALTSPLAPIRIKVSLVK
ncbi:MAG: hypothetical protein WBB70_04830, partial [Desulfobacterales bacterium]